MENITTAFVLGLIGGFIPGPVLTAIFTDVLQNGFAKSVKIIFLAFLAETFVAVFSLVFFVKMGFPEYVFKSISILGASILIWISFSLWKIKSLDTGEKLKFSFWKILILILSNGMLWTYWITICIPKAIQLGEVIQQGEYLFVAFVELGWIITTTLSAFIFSRFRILLSKPTIVPILFKVFACVFVYFALNLLYDSYKFFI